MTEKRANSAVTESSKIFQTLVIFPKFLETIYLDPHQVTFWKFSELDHYQ